MLNAKKIQFSNDIKMKRWCWIGFSWIRHVSLVALTNRIKMLAFRIFVAFVFVLFCDCQEHKEIIQVCDNFAFSNALNHSEINDSEKLIKSSIKNVLDYPNFVKFTSENISIGCREASASFQKSLENVELWALESKSLLN